MEVADRDGFEGAGLTVGTRVAFEGGRLEVTLVISPRAVLFAAGTREVVEVDFRMAGLPIGATFSS